MADPSVLVIDDEPGIVLLCERLLGRAGFQVTSCNNPLLGVARLEQERYDLLLVDIRMPEMDGFQLISLAHQRQPDLAVVIMTGFGTVETAIEALRRGADSLVLKPFAGADLVETVRRALQENREKRDVMKLQTLRPLFTITEALFAETNPERLQQFLLDTITSHLGCSQAGLYRRMFGRSTGPATYRLVAGRGDLALEEPDSPEQGMLARALSLGLPLEASVGGPGDLGLQAMLAQGGYQSILCAPVVVKESSLFLLAARQAGESVFRESDLETFAILARQASVALENALLHAQLRAYIRQVEESQRALIQAEKMAIAGRLTASIAHEINNPLQSVRNCLHLSGREELTLAERQDYQHLALVELERLTNTVQRMLDYYRPSALDRKPEDLNELLRRVLLLVKKQLDDHQVELSLHPATSLPPVMVVGDQIQQVFLNLILNAVEAMPQGGLITIDTRRLKNSVEVFIEDTGPGVPAGERERIFEPFVSSKAGGTGLGLAVSYGIIAAHGGNLELVQGRGSGACFRFTLPAETPPGELEGPSGGVL